MRRDRDWEWCGQHDCVSAHCEHLHSRPPESWHWTEVSAVAVALLLALVLLMGLAR